jgi:hypothetical protein
MVPFRPGCANKRAPSVQCPDADGHDNRRKKRSRASPEGAEVGATGSSERPASVDGKEWARGVLLIYGSEAVVGAREPGER